MQEEDWRTQAQYWFNLHHKLARSFDPDLANYYSDSAYLQRTLIRKDGTQQHRAMPGLMYKEAIRNLMGLAKQLNDINDIADLVFTKEGRRVKATYNRYSHLKDFTSPTKVVFGIEGEEAGIIFEEYTISREQ